MKQTMVYWLLCFGFALAMLFSLGTLLFERLWLQAHIFVHFQLQYVCAIALCTLGFLALRRWRLFGLGFFYVLVAYAFLLHSLQLLDGSVDKVDVFYINAQYDLQDVEPMVDAIQQYAPNAVAIVESNDALVQGLNSAGFEAAVDHRALFRSCTAMANNYKSADLVFYGNFAVCMIRFEAYDLIVVHAHPPLSKQSLGQNLMLFDRLVSLIESYEVSGTKFLMVGDFNTTRYSAYFREPFGDYLVTNAYTWMVHMPYALPIDHVITNMEVDVARSKNIGSDHRGLMVQIVE